jgi:glycolate oxidase iron-sulfur subunit
MINTEELKGKDTELLQLSSCIRCGTCKALCPTYIEDATEGMSARGRVILLKKYINGELNPSKILDKRIFSCMLCGACNSLCPLGIKITDAVYEGRKNLRKFNNRKLLSFFIKVAFKKISSAFGLFSTFKNIIETSPVNKLQPFKMLKELDVKVPDSTLRDSVSISKVPRPRGRIAVFAGCTVNFLYPHVGSSLISSLNKLNYDVILPKGEVCCGAPLLGLGFEEDAAELAEKNIKMFKGLKVEAVIGLCPTCIYFIKDEYLRLIGEGIENAIDASRFFMEKMPDISPVTDSGSRIVYHDPCYSLYHLNVSAEPRHILKSMGFNVIDSENGCCGFGGSFRLLYQELSDSILEKRIKEYGKADMIVTSCPNCIIQFRSKMKDKQIKHIIEVIDKAIKGDKNERKR